MARASIVSNRQADLSRLIEVASGGARCGTPGLANLSPDACSKALCLCCVYPLSRSAKFVWNPSWVRPS